MRSSATGARRPRRDGGVRPQRPAGDHRPAQDGGGDLPTAVLADVVRTIAAADPAIAQMPQAHYLMVDVLAVKGSDDQRHECSATIAGRRIANALAERGGKHAQDLKTRLRPKSGAVSLLAVKYYATGALSRGLDRGLGARRT